MSNCNHANEAEVKACNERTVLVNIAKDAQRLLKTRKAMMDGMIVGADWDALSEQNQASIRRLELEVREAERLSLLTEEEHNSHGRMTTMEELVGYLERELKCTEQQHKEASCHHDGDAGRFYTAANVLRKALQFAEKGNA